MFLGGSERLCFPFILTNLGNFSNTPQQLRYDNRAVVYLQANIQAGEVEGKEASLILARDILLADKLSYLDDLIVLICPILNPDGNEKISPENRRNQIGPEKGGECAITDRIWI